MAGQTSQPSPGHSLKCFPICVHVHGKVRPSTVRPHPGDHARQCDETPLCAEATPAGHACPGAAHTGPQDRRLHAARWPGCQTVHAPATWPLIETLVQEATRCALCPCLSGSLYSSVKGPKPHQGTGGLTSPRHVKNESPSSCSRSPFVTCQGPSVNSSKQPVDTVRGVWAHEARRLPAEKSNPGKALPSTKARRPLTGT